MSAEAGAVSEDAVLDGRLILRQPRRGHRVGHDAILLAAATDARAGERAVDLAPEEVERPEHPVLAGAGDAPEMRPADQNGARAERERLYDIDAAAEAAVNEHRRPPADRFDDSG